MNEHEFGLVANTLRAPEGIPAFQRARRNGSEVVNHVNASGVYTLPVRDIPHAEDWPNDHHDDPRELAAGRNRGEDATPKRHLRTHTVDYGNYGIVTVEPESGPVVDQWRQYWRDESSRRL